ncbi:MAG: helix-turn-helix domain-containing protein [bacterium]|nr:helix-turn-helix domain-containing protein [bacterium]
MPAEQAAELLGIKRATLYAYVSRGWVASRPAGLGREREYRRADLEDVRGRGRSRQRGDRALRWGEPVLETSITDMTPAGPVYRGVPAASLAEDGVSFERCAELLWTGVLPEAGVSWVDALGDAPDFGEIARWLPTGASPASVASLLVAAEGGRDAGRFEIAPEALLPRARRLIRLLAAGLALPGSPARAEQAWREESTAEAALCALGGPQSGSASLNAGLVLLADHELNASTFAARVVASTHADVYACVQGGLAALSGPLHGAVTDRVEAALAEAGAALHAERLVHERARRGERVPGFGHPFYPDGDPRAKQLFEAAFGLGPASPELQTLDALVGAMERARRPLPNVDLGLVALRAALGLPVGSAAGIFCVGRCAGWVAHVLEQQASGQLLRPRARYKGA